MITLPHLVALFVIGLAYCVLCLVKPMRKCQRCKTTPGRSARYAGVAGPVGKCRKCRGDKKHRRFAASLVHWFIWAAIVDPIREHRDNRGSGQQFSYAPPRTTYAASTPAGSHYAARLRAAQRADRLRAFQTRLQARTAPRSWAFA
jgi:hypothetical protein